MITLLNFEIYLIVLHVYHANTIVFPKFQHDKRLSDGKKPKMLLFVDFLARAWHVHCTYMFMSHRKSAHVVKQKDNHLELLTFFRTVYLCKYCVSNLWPQTARLSTYVYDAIWVESRWLICSKLFWKNNIVYDLRLYNTAIFYIVWKKKVQNTKVYKLKQ